MKNIIIIFCLSLFINNSYSQSVGILCDIAGSGSCFGSFEPGTAIKYRAEPQDFPPNATLTFAWSTVGGSVSPTNAQEATANWSNTSNSPTPHSITVTVTGGGKTATATQTVSVKHIGPITIVTASGGGVTQTATGNNGTITIPCGATTFNLTVTPPPTTDPITQVTYTWNFPWGVQTTNSTTVTTTSNIGGSTPITVVHRNNNILSFDVANLPRGLYYLNFVFEGNKTFTEQIVLD